MPTPEENLSAKKAVGASFKAPDDATATGELHIPEQYKGRTSEELEWKFANPTLYANPEQNAAARRREVEILTAVKKQETLREQGKQRMTGERYSKLPDAQKADFPNAQREANSQIRDFITQDKDIPGLSREDAFLLQKLRGDWKQLPEEQRSQFFQRFAEHLTGHVDSQVYENLVNRLAFDVLKARGKVGDEAEADKIRESIGIPTKKSEAGTSEKTTESSGLSEEEINAILYKVGDLVRSKRGTGDVVNQDLIVNLTTGGREFIDIGKDFDAHGIAKLGYRDQLMALKNLLEKGVDKKRDFFHAPLVVDESTPHYGTAGGAYKDGSFIVLSEHGGSLESGDIKYVLVNDAFYDAMDKLRATYPKVKFIRADQARETLTAEVFGKSRGETGKESKPETATVDEKRYLDPTYTRHLVDVFRDAYYKLTPAERKLVGPGSDINKASGKLLEIPFQIRDKWKEKNVDGTPALTQAEATSAAKTLETFLKGKGLI